MLDPSVTIPSQILPLLGINELTNSRRGPAKINLHSDATSWPVGGPRAAHRAVAGTADVSTRVERAHLSRRPVVRFPKGGSHGSIFPFRHFRFSEDGDHREPAYVVGRCGVWPVRRLAEMLEVLGQVGGSKGSTRLKGMHEEGGWAGGGKGGTQRNWACMAGRGDENAERTRCDVAYTASGERGSDKFLGPQRRAPEGGAKLTANARGLGRAAWTTIRQIWAAFLMQSKVGRGDEAGAAARTRAANRIILPFLLVGLARPNNIKYATNNMRRAIDRADVARAGIEVAPALRARRCTTR
ncbi:hypothetical protein FB451DRAFT_1178724 [Mycena latifolia]|nr:hypothetical protein FB451DRAFT_1178724 [Mycena latifolia]